MKLKFTLDPGAKAPTRAHETDAGLDLCSRVNAVIRPGKIAIFDTGVHVAIPKGYVGLLTSKSGLMQHEVTSRGTIDAGYTGSIHAVLFNHGKDNVVICKGQKITQLVICPIITPDPEQVDSLEETERGDGGFGSTGKF
jgi:dUTP pyrophosphatase